MSEMNEMNKISDEALEEVTGGVGRGDRGDVGVRACGPYWIRTTAKSGLHCRTAPRTGKIIKTYEYGHRLKIDGITTDGEWYRLLVYHPEGGTCYGFICKAYTERV